ncbi:single-stranded DNA-binding protein 2 isoform X5 [Hemicordylus capensis]|uniref:single-stranded DNA-binding protein 2 isoform X5 n=1 Tax=Hemicordylus capensis TaxID=884348 RepID=UPI0023021B6A|nr:single-stranded DNA-binding protein 2 isoform X5 [Hemicordylus capensis]
MYGKGKSNSSVPSDSQAREKLALYVYEYLLHVGAQKSAQTFLSEIRWEKNITLGEPPGFLHSWWCVFWDLYCAAPERRETCEHSSEAKAFHDYSAAAAPSPVLGNIPPGDGMPVGPVPPGFFQGPAGSQPSPHAQPPTHNPSNPTMGPHGQPFMSPRYPGGPRPPLRIPNQALGGVPGSQPLLPSGMDPTRQQGHPNMAGPMQRMTPPRGMVPLGPQSDPWLSLQNYGGAMRPPLNALGGPGMPGMNMHMQGLTLFASRDNCFSKSSFSLPFGFYGGPGGGRPWPNPTNANSIPYSSASPGNYVGPPGGGGPPGTPIMPSPADSTNSGDNMYTLMNAVPPGPNRPNFPMGPGSDGPMGGLGGMDSHHMNGSLGSGDMDSISKNSPSNMSMSNQPGTPRDDGEMGGNFLNPFQSESYSPSMTMSV